MTKKRKFTLLELIFVIAAMAIGAFLILAALTTIGLKARDAQRKSDLRQASIALGLYHASHGTYVVAGAGSDGEGNGWFSYAGTTYPKSVAKGLVDDGDINKELVDPSGARIGNSPLGHTGYMIVADADHYTLWADLEDPSAADKATMDSCNSSTYDGFPTFPAPTSSQMNYCISH